MLSQKQAEGEEPHLSARGCFVFGSDAWAAAVLGFVLRGGGGPIGTRGVEMVLMRRR